MAVATRTEGLPAPRESRKRPGSGFELWSWLFMRISGIVLLFLAVVEYLDHQRRKRIGA